MPTCLPYTNAETYTNRHIHSQRKEYPWRYVRATKKIAYKKQNRKKINIKCRIGNGNSQRKEYGEILAGKKNRIKKIKKKKKIKRQIGNGTNADESHTTTLQLRIESQNTKTYLQ